MEILLIVFEEKNFVDIENINLDNVIKCFIIGLESRDKEVVNKSIICLGKLVEIKEKNNYNINLLLKYEENHVIEKLNFIILNNRENEKQHAETLLNYIKNKIKEDE